MSCTKSKEVHPEIGDGNDEIVTVGMTDVHVEYTRTDHAELSHVVFHYCPANTNGNAQQFEAAEMTKKETIFELTLSDLLSDTLYWYYYELFPNSGDAFNTIQKTFQTQAFEQPEPPTPPTPPSDVPEGAINGLFTINENGEHVYFSQGNLQYQASTNTWRFAENQWDFVGGVDYGTGMEFGNVYEQSVKCSNGLISFSYNGWIDLFGWGTSGWNSGNTYYQPWSSDWLEESNYGELYGPLGNHDFTGEYANSDWGIYNAISNGGNLAGLWRTLTISEWDYIFHSRHTASNIHFVKAEVAGVNGIILLPDDWSNTVYTLYETDNGNVEYSNNVIDAATWTEIFEANYAVFLPAAGYRGQSSGNISLDYFNRQCAYWSASNYNNSNGYYAGTLSSYYSFLYIEEDIFVRCFGLSVRLVQDAN